MATRAASFALYILLLTLCSSSFLGSCSITIHARFCLLTKLYFCCSICVGGAEVGGLTEYPVAASATPYCGRNFIASQGKCDDTNCWSLCHDQYIRRPKVIHVGGACETPTCCLCEVDCEWKYLVRLCWWEMCILTWCVMQNREIKPSLLMALVYILRLWVDCFDSCFK